VVRRDDPHLLPAAPFIEDASFGIGHAPSPLIQKKPP
jgi:hypothetical protein